MRRAMRPQMLFESDLNPEAEGEQSGAFLGINLGADFCAEHEWGIKDLNRDLDRDTRTHKVNAKISGVKNDRWCLHGLAFGASKDEEVAVLVFDRWYSSGEKFTKSLEKPMTAEQFKTFVNQNGPRELDLYRDDTLATAWDQGSFGIMVAGKKNVALLRELNEAFAKGDIAMWLGGGGVFKNAGLCIAIYSRLPQSVKDGWREHYEDMDRLQKAAEKTGIAKKLEKAGRRWYALSPRWAKGIKNINTKHPVIFWLNPMEQRKYDAGWMTVEDLEDWIEEKGKCMLTPEKKAERASW